MYENGTCHSKANVFPRLAPKGIFDFPKWKGLYDLSNYQPPNDQSNGRPEILTDFLLRTYTWQARDGSTVQSCFSLSMAVTI